VKCNFTRKTALLRSSLGACRGNVRCSYLKLILWTSCSVRDNWTFFAMRYGWRGQAGYERISIEIALTGSVWSKISGTCCDVTDRGRTERTWQYRALHYMVKTRIRQGKPMTYDTFVATKLRNGSLVQCVIGLSYVGHIQ